VHTLVYATVNQLTEFELLIFTRSKDMTGASKFKASRFVLTTPLG